MPGLILPNGQPISMPRMPPEPAPDAPGEEEVPDGTEVPEDTAPELLPVITAFIVYMLPNGQWQVSNELDVALVPDRQAASDDLTAGCATVLRDVQTQEFAAVLNAGLTNIGNAIVQSTVQGVIQGQMQLAQQAMEGRQQANLAAKLEQDKQRRGGR